MSHELSHNTNYTLVNEKLRKIQLKILRPQDYLPTRLLSLRRFIPLHQQITESLAGYRTFFEGGVKLGAEVARLAGLIDHEAEAVGQAFQLGLEQKALTQITQQTIEQEGTYVERDELSTYQEAEVITIREGNIPDLYEITQHAYKTHRLLEPIDEEAFYTWQRVLSQVGFQLARYITFSENMTPTYEGIMRITDMLHHVRPTSGADFAILNATLRRSEIKAFTRQQEIARKFQPQ